MIRTVIVDDHPLYRQGLKQVIVEDPRFELVGEAGSGRDAIQLITQQQPDLAVLDIHLPDMTGLDVAQDLKARQCATRLVVLTMLRDEQAFNQAISLGIQGYVLKENAVSEIVNCLLAVAAGDAYVSPAVSGLLLRRHQRANELKQGQPNLDQLTVAERRILKRIAQKRSSKEIAVELAISPRTVESHRAKICTKLALRGNNSLLQFALEHRDALAGLD